MLVRARVLVVAAVLACGTPGMVPAGQVPPPTRPTPEDVAIATGFGVALTEHSRKATLRQYPWLAEPVGLRAILLAADAQIGERDAAMAERTYRSLQWLGDHIGNDRARINALSGLGNVEGNLRGNLSAALTLSEEALAFAERVGDRRAGLTPLINLGIIHRRFGDYDAASGYFARAMDVAEAEQQTPSISRVLNNIGTMHYYLGHLGLAREYFERSIAMKVDDGGRGTLDLANSLANVGILYLDVGDPRQALSYMQRALSLFERVSQGRSTLFVLASMSRAHLALGELDEAGHVLMRAVQLADASADNVAIAQTLFLRGLLSRDRGDLADAAALQQQSLALRLDIGDVPSIAESHAELSHLALKRERPVEAEVEARKALEVAVAADLLGQQATAFFHLAQALDAQGSTSDAAAAYRSAIEAVERSRERALGENAARQVFMRERLGPFTGLAALHARTGRAWDALSTMEQARARALLDIVTSGPMPTRLLSDAQRRRERDVMHALATRTQQLKTVERNAGTSAAEIQARQQDLRHAREAYDRFQQDLLALHPRLRLARGGTPVITRDVLAGLVQPGTAAVQFVLDPQHAWVYLVRGGAAGATVTAHRLLMPSASLATLGQRFAEQVGTRDLGFAATARQLYAALFAQVDAELHGVTRLIVVPDGPLWNVPFQALTTPRGRYLLEERAVSYAPSLSALAALRARAQTRPNRTPALLALGDPADGDAAEADSRRGVTGQLPEARREVTSLGQLYGKNRSTVLVGPDATEAALREAASGASVLHIASHGVLDDLGPMYSHLRLAPNRGDDGRLEAWELADLELSADVVVLSACQTARGAVGGGEGVVGLSWALLAAGASSAVLSQWEVDSASTTALMIGFHQRLLKGGRTPEAAPEALRQAALAMLKDARYRHPFYWAGFVVMGS